MTKRLVCPKCGWEWDYKGSMKKASCPSCQAKVEARRDEECQIK